MIVKCQKHGIEYDNYFKVGVTAFNVKCPKCIEEAKAQEVQEEQRKERERERAELRAMNIEPEYYHAGMGNFIATTPELKKNAGLVQKLIDGQVRELVMVGKNGTGKTHLAVAAVKAFRGKLLSMYEISARIRASYKDRVAESELDIVDELASLPLLTIDEIGRTKGSGAELDWLSYIIDKRHTRGLPTILISNKHLRRDCPASGCANCLENFVGEDVMSRLSESGLVLRFNGEDFRRKRGAEKKEAATV